MDSNDTKARKMSEERESGQGRLTALVPEAQTWVYVSHGHYALVSASGRVLADVHCDGATYSDIWTTGGVRYHGLENAKKAAVAGSNKHG